jgi:PAS domain S-box-containing protein
MEASPVNLSPERFQTIVEDGEFVLCRQHDSTDALSPSRSLLVVIPRFERPRPQVVRMLEHEHSLRHELDPAWAIRPLALTTLDGRAVLVLEDPGGELLVRRVGTPMDVGEALRVAAGLATALRQLHGRGLIHKDIKPANVMTDQGTGQVWLRGFGIASRVPRERPLPAPPEFIAGTLAYMAPEQTGWMNRSLDARSDLYALGVVLYELLTGNLPFTASDPMAWVHAHIARRPVPPSERLNGIPDVVSAIVMKLLAKTAEERYQTAAGVERDLRRCLAQWEAERRIDAFPPAEHDTPDRFLIPEKLYGREREIEGLISAFGRVMTSGTPELVLVSGYSGIGKSSVVNELHKVLVPPRALFASGKFDQYGRDIPYATLAQAFQGLIRRLLGEREADLAPWRDAFREALGPNGRLMVDLVPELTLIIGDQPPVPDLPAQDARRRFHLVFRRFIGVFTRGDHALALFLDDLQWLDAATLDFLEDLLSPAGVPHLLVVGAYRDNEVTAAHPLMRTLDAIRNAGANVGEIRLAPLASGDVAQLIVDALRCDRERAVPLAQLVHAKTAGNPFFTIQFMSSLADERLLIFDHEAGRWSWDLDRIQAVGYTDNVVDLMVGKLTRLPAETRRALQQFACLGSSAPTAMLSIVLGVFEEQVHASLWPAVRQGLVERMPDSYRFVHDRVQESGYALIPEDERPEEHRRIGRLLAAHTPREAIAEHVFEIVSQFNRATTLIAANDERQRVAELNLIAGQRAKDTTAYESALIYLNAGRALLPEDCWERCGALTFALEIHRAECEFVTGAFAAAEERLSMLSSHAVGSVDFAAVTQLREELFTTIGLTDRAVEACLDYLRRIGVEWSAHPTAAEVEREYESIWRQIGSRSIGELVDLPLMVNPEWRATMDVLAAAIPPAFFTDENLHCMVICRMANLSLAYGNSDGSGYAYVILGMLLGPRFGKYSDGFSFGKLGLGIVEQRGLRRFEARVYLNFGSLVSPWAEPAGAGLSLVRRAFDSAIRLGDVTFATYSRTVLISELLATGQPLDAVDVEAEAGLDFARQFRIGLVHATQTFTQSTWTSWSRTRVDLITTHLRLIRTLRGLTREFGSFNDADFDEGRFEHEFAADSRRSIVASRYWIRKLQACFFAGDYGAAVVAASKVPGLLSTPPFYEQADFELYGALAHAALCDTGSTAERTEHHEALAAHDRRLRKWAEACPTNLEDRAALVGAEVARVEGREMAAERLYEQAIRSARQQGFIQNEGLAYELAARFQAARGFEAYANLYLRNARHCYRRWGADGKVRQLDELYPRLSDDEPAPDSRGTIGEPVERLELATVLKVSQAVSGEIVLEKLVDTVLRTAMAHAGADRGVLIVPRGDDLRIQAEASTDGSAVPIALRDVPLGSAALPESVVRYAARVHETVHLDDASARGAFSSDEYIRREHARSVLCLPLLQQRRLMALLYLENNLAAGVFTPARMAVLNVLASQAAMSLEKTRLYQELQQREAKIRRLVDANIVGVSVATLEGQIVDANDAFLNMLGYNRDDLISGRLRWTQLTPPDWSAVTEQALAQIAAHGTCDVYEKEYLRKDGSRVPVLIAAAAVEETTGEIVGFVLDLTERKRAEQERERLRQLQAHLAHLNRVTTMGELAASIAHEIKQPIAAAKIDARVCMRALADDRLDVGSAREAAARLVNDATRADEIIKRTTALYKKDTIQRERVDINAMIREMALLFQQEARASSIAIQTRLIDGIPPVMADGVQLQQVLMNLMLNAIDAMKESGGVLTITSQISEEGELLISITDTGVGLPTENPDQIFDSFVTTKPHGTGMGLAITRSIVESHGGRLWAIANDGPGATFMFTLANDVAEQRT